MKSFDSVANNDEIISGIIAGIASANRDIVEELQDKPDAKSEKPT